MVCGFQGRDSSKDSLKYKNWACAEINLRSILLTNSYFINNRLEHSEIAEIYRDKKIAKRSDEFDQIYKMAVYNVNL